MYFSSYHKHSHLLFYTELKGCLRLEVLISDTTDSDIRTNRFLSATVKEISIPKCIQQVNKAHCLNSQCILTLQDKYVFYIDVGKVRLGQSQSYQKNIFAIATSPEDQITCVSAKNTQLSKVRSYITHEIYVLHPIKLTRTYLLVNLAVVVRSAVYIIYYSIHFPVSGFSSVLYLGTNAGR